MGATKVLFYTHALVDGGAERLWATLASTFKARGFDVHFVQDFAASDALPYLDPEIPVHTLGRGHARAIMRLARLLRRLRPQVALSAVGGSNLKLVAATSLSLSRTSSILSFHGSEEHKTGKLSHATYRALPLLSRRAARIIAVSHGLRQSLITDWKADPGKVITLHNPVYLPASAAAPSTAELQERDDLVLSAGRLVPEKDFLTLVRAFARLERPAARLVILGKGPQRDTILAEAAKLGIASQVELPGFVAEPWSVYARARCFVSPSRTEQFGNAIVEAMAYGLPVVATRCDGPREILEDGRHGAIVPIGEPAIMAEAIRAALDNPGDPAPRRERAHHFSMEARVPDYIALVEEVVGEHHRTPDQTTVRAAIDPAAARHRGSGER